MNDTPHTRTLTPAELRARLMARLFELNDRIHDHAELIRRQAQAGLSLSDTLFDRGLSLHGSRVELWHRLAAED